MGAWGTGIYDNDDAADWSVEVAELGFRPSSHAKLMRDNALDVFKKIAG